MKKLTYETGARPIWDEATVEKTEGLLNKKYLAYLDDEFFELQSGETRDQVQIKLTLVGKDRTIEYPIECVHVLRDDSEILNQEVAELMLDYLDVYWNEYLSGGRDVFVPLDWSQHTCEGVEFYMRGFVRHVHLERSADALLREHGHGAYDIEPIDAEK